MFTFSESKASSKSQPRPSLRFQTFNGWSGTIERVRAFVAPPEKPRKSIWWLRRGDNNQSVEKSVATAKQSISLPLTLDYSPFPLMVAPMSPRPAEVAEAPVPVYGVDTNDHTRFRPICTSTDVSRPYRIRRINTRKQLPWIPISKPLPPRPSPPDTETGPVTGPSLSMTPLSSAYSYYTTPRNSLEGAFDDGLDDLSLFLRRIAYYAITASTVHRHLGFMEDGGRVLPLGRRRGSGRRRLSPPRRYSSLVGVSLAIMEGRLPKALVVM